jgi:hypothetical protein
MYLLPDAAADAKQPLSDSRQNGDGGLNKKKLISDNFSALK